MAVHQMKPLRYRSIFISDVHLGFRGCRADFLLDFLRNTECEYLYLVGDIIDVWEMKNRMFWPQEHNNVVRTILGKAKHDSKSSSSPATTTKSSATTPAWSSATSPSRRMPST